MKKNTQIIKIIQKDKFNEEDKMELIAILKKLPIQDLISLFGKDFKKHTKNYVKWGWDFYEYIKKDMLISYINKYKNLIVRKGSGIYDRGINTLFGDSMFDMLGKSATGLGLTTIGQAMPINSDSRKNKDTKLLIDYVKAEITKLAPSNEFYQGRLPSWRISKYLGLKYYKVGPRYMDSISNKLKYLKKNPDYKFSQEELAVAKASLLYSFGQKANHIINRIKLYEESNILKAYPMEQHNVGDPHVFKTLDNPLKSFWHGFLSADGSLIIRKYKEGDKYSPKYNIFIELQEQDRLLLEQFRDFVQLDPAASSYQIKYREREWRSIIYGKIYKSNTAYLSFTCRPMGEDLVESNFKSSKAERKDLPNFNSYTQGLDEQTKREIIISWVLGYYIGDGITGTTRIVAANRQFLEQIKQLFKIKNNVIIIAKETWYLDKEGDLKHRRSMYSLSLGGRLFNEMWAVGQKYGLGLQRKYKLFSERRSTYDILLEKLDLLNIDNKILQEMVHHFRQYELIEIFSTTVTAFQKLRQEWKIIFPPNGYWKTGNNYLGQNQK